jgi:hypothetical protein
MKLSVPPTHAVCSAILALVFAGSAQAEFIVPGFVRESRGQFEYNTGVINAGDEIFAAFTYFGAYPGHFDTIAVSFYPGASLEFDSEISVGTFNKNSFFWSGDVISGTGLYSTYYNPFGRLRITATYQDVVAGSHIGNVNIKGLYVPDTGSTLALLGGAVSVVFAARAASRKK